MVRARLSLIPLALALSAVPVLAQTDAMRDLNDLVDASRDPQAGIRLARDQYGAGDLTGAEATLERVLLDHPEHDDALILHASLLCRMDDKEGARIELAELKFGISEQAWDDVTDACGSGMPRPGGRG